MFGLAAEVLAFLRAADLSEADLLLLSESRVGPIYVVDISRPAQPLALMIFPGYGTLASGETAEVMRRMVETVKVGE